MKSILTIIAGVMISLSARAQSVDHSHDVDNGSNYRDSMPHREIGGPGTDSNLTRGKAIDLDRVRYCATSQGNGMVLTQDGRRVTYDVTLGDGSRVMGNGQIIKKDGTRKTLKKGECIDRKGNITNAED